MAAAAGAEMAEELAAWALLLAAHGAEPWVTPCGGAATRAHEQGPAQSAELDAKPDAQLAAELDAELDATLVATWGRRRRVEAVFEAADGRGAGCVGSAERKAGSKTLRATGRRGGHRGGRGASTSSVCAAALLFTTLEADVVGTGG